MTTYAEILELAKQRLADCLADPKPSYSIEGESYSWTEYQSLLMKQITFLEEKVSQEEDGPYEEETSIFL